MSSATPARPSIAFFDVDETLISIKSMFDFYSYFIEAVGHGPEERQRLHGATRSLQHSGLPREQGNRLFYRGFANYKVDEVAAVGQQWFDAHLERGGLFHTDVVDALHRHRTAGTTTVLVSGSFPACVDPVSAHCGADLAMSTQLEVREGIYTGEVTRTMIGEAKAEIARELITQAGVSAADCHAYGDHTSDLGLLRLVGHPVVVGAQPEMAEIADAAGWVRLPGTRD